MINPMDGYLAHVDGSTLKVALCNAQEPLKYIKEDLLPTAAAHSKIIDAQEFTKEFSRMLTKNFGGKLPKLPLYFILDPEVTQLFLLTSSKNLENEEEFFINQVKERLVDEQLDDLYFSYYKIAPFIYQFVGIRKVYMAVLMEVASTLGLEIGAILPLGLLLSKTNSDISSMFVLPKTNGHTVVFSELTGVTFAEKLGGKVSTSELKELFWKLSVYNNKQGELDIYDFAKTGEALNTALESGFEEVDLAQAVIEKCPTLVDTQTNLLNILPLPQVEERKKVPVVVTATITSMLLVSAVVVQLTVGFNNILKLKLPEQRQSVLANQDQVVEQPAQQPTEQQPKKEVKRTDLKIRVENGNGVAGSAGKLKEYLEGFGYTVVSVGNADETDYEKTLVNLPNSLVDYTDLLTNDLKTNYSVEIKGVDTVPNGYDILIIAGLK